MRGCARLSLHRAASSKVRGGEGKANGLAETRTRHRGRGADRRLRPWPLRHRCQHLPGRARRRRRAAPLLRRRGRAFRRPRGRAAADRARRRHQPGRPDRQHRRRRRLLAPPERAGRARRREPPRRCRTRHRAGRAEPPPQARTASGSRRRLDGVARHHRRHGGEQFLRLALDPLRHDARQHARHRRACSPTAAAAASRRRRATATTRWCRTCSRSAPARPTRSRPASRRCSAASAATTSTRWSPATARCGCRTSLVGSEGTLAVSERVEIRLSPVLTTKAARRLPLPDLPRRDGGGAAPRRRSTPSRSSWSTRR